MSEELAIPEGVTQFEQGGFTYHQTWRKCNKPNCKCQTDWDHRHGPYWQKKRAYESKYIGKKLPQPVIKAYLSLKSETKNIQSCINSLREEQEGIEKQFSLVRRKIKALENLKNGRAIFKEDHEIIEEFELLFLIPDEPEN